MITIQGFAKLCGCNTQTLRYYDRIGLLIPAKVDPWTGYRYYEEEQALQFVKIKNLQQADFSIGEIRPLLAENGDRLREAFARKIAEQERKLERIREIQETYLKEEMEMQETICTLATFIEKRADNPALWAEFGLDDAQGTEVSARAHEILADWLTQIRSASGEIARQTDGRALDAVRAVTEALSDGVPDGKNLLVSAVGADGGAGEEIPAGAETVFERAGWAHVSEWIGSLPQLDGDKQTVFLFRVRPDSTVGDPGFPMMLLAVMASGHDVLRGGISCRVGRSDDGRNHVAVLQKQRAV